MSTLRLIAGMMLLAGAGAVSAARFCVASETALTAALTAASTNGVDDEIDLVAHTYPVTQQIVYAIGNSEGLRVIGGWDTTCTARTGGASVLDGGGTQIIALFNSNGDISIEQIIFANGKPGLQVLSMGGNVQVERNVFFNNVQTGSGSGGLLAGATVGSVLLRNNLFAYNSGGHGGGARVSGNGAEVVVTNNTFVLNQTNSVGDAGGLYVDGTAHATLSNNIVWASAGSAAVDLFVTSANARYHNDIGSWDGVVADAASSGELSVAPGFVACTVLPCGDFRLGAGSPLVDVGRDDPPGGLGPFDLDGLPRVLGAHVDIGAYEQDPRLFASGFE